jgi:Holliday junction DNA helicase RuvA
MIGRIAGRLDHRGADAVLIDVNGVGYIVHCAERTLAAMPPVGQAVALYTDLQVREDLLQLYGFATMAEREWHRLLMTVQGVGAKASMAILGVLGADGVARAIALGDWASVKAAPGVGPKIAQRVVLELKGKAPQMMAAGLAPKPAPAAAGKPLPGGPAPAASASAEAMSALANLGYAPAEAASAGAEAAAAAPEADTPALIRAALRLLAPKG